MTDFIVNSITASMHDKIFYHAENCTILMFLKLRLHPDGVQHVEWHASF